MIEHDNKKKSIIKNCSNKNTTENTAKTFSEI